MLFHLLLQQWLFKHQPPLPVSKVWFYRGETFTSWPNWRFYRMLKPFLRLKPLWACACIRRGFPVANEEHPLRSACCYGLFVVEPPFWSYPSYYRFQYGSDHIYYLCSESPTLHLFLTTLVFIQERDQSLGQLSKKSEHWIYVPLFSLPSQGEIRSRAYCVVERISGHEFSNQLQCSWFWFPRVQETFNWFLYFLQGQFVCIFVKFLSPSGKEGLQFPILPSYDITPRLDTFFFFSKSYTVQGLVKSTHIIQRAENIF